MALRTVWHGVFEHVDRQGHRALAFYGDEVDLSDSEIERGDRLGVFNEPVVEVPLDVVVVEPAVAGEPATLAVVEPDLANGRPKPAEAKAVWVEWAVSTQGLSAVEAEGMSKAELVALGREPAVPGSKPLRVAARGTWVDYAIAHGVTADEAESMTRDELIARFQD